MENNNTPIAQLIAKNGKNHRPAFVYGTLMKGERAEQLLDAVGLSDCRDKYPHQLSGGQKQRIAICRALAYGGDILLLDEPLKGLDADTRDQVSALLRQEWTGKTLLLVTHDPSEAQSLCDRVYRWQEGTFR